MPETPTTVRVPETSAQAFSGAPSSPGLFRRSTGTTRRWLKDTSSREQMFAGLKQLAWVAPLTVLIWVYAERAQQHTETVRFRVVARSSNPQVHVTVSEPSDAVVQASLEGARSRLEKVLGRSGAQDPVFVEVPPDAKPGIRTFTVEEILDGDARFRGLSLQDSPSSTPERVEVLVDPVVERTLTVELRKQDADRIERAVFTPAKVKVRMPGEVARLARAAHDGQLVVYADLGTVTDQGPGDKRIVSDVRVFVDGGEREEVKIDPTTVSAALTLREEVQVFKIVQLPVNVSGATGVTNEYEVEFEPATLFNVEVVGPAGAIQKLARDNAASVRAHVWVTREDANPDSPPERNVEFILPDQVRLHDDSKGVKVRVTMTRRTSDLE